jgi:hypothetical protein
MFQFRKISVAAFFLMFVLGAQEGRTTSPPTGEQLETAMQVSIRKCQAVPQPEQCGQYVGKIAKDIWQCGNTPASYDQCIQALMSQVQDFVSLQQKGCPLLSREIAEKMPRSCLVEVKRSCLQSFNSSDFNTCALKKLASDSNCSAYVPCSTKWEIPLQFLQQFA